MSERDRLIALEGAMNFRDLGGYATTDGRRVGWGRIYRSDGLHELTDADLDVLHGLGIRVVCDLRNTNEVNVDVSRFPDPARVRGAGAPGDDDVTRLHVPIGGEAAEAPSVLELIRAGEIAQLGVDAVVGIYGAMVEHGAGPFGTVVRNAADPANHPLLFHCTAGKDRTGVTAMLILSVLGVADDDILDDYELTTKYRSGRRVEQLRPELERVGVDVDAVLPFLIAHRAVMAGTIALIRERWGSVEGYLTGPAGVDAATIGQLRDVLLEPLGSEDRPRNA
jgi:protein-tyrosine phosphatase